MTDWGKIAVARGYTSSDDKTIGDPKALLTGEYAKHGSIEALAGELNISRHVVRVAMERYDVPVKKQGGPQRSTFEVTETLLNLIEEIGLTAAARTVPCEYTTLYKRTRAVLKTRREQRAEAEQSSSPLPDEKGSPHRG